MICPGYILKPQARNVENSFQRDLLQIIVNIVHHHLEVMVLEQGKIDCLVELEFCAFENKWNDSRVFIEIRDLILSEISSVIVSEIRPDTKERSVLSEGAQDESDYGNYLWGKVIFRDPERHSWFQYMGRILGIVMVDRRGVEGRSSFEDLRDHLVLGSKVH